MGACSSPRASSSVSRLLQRRPAGAWRSERPAAGARRTRGRTCAGSASRAPRRDARRRARSSSRAPRAPPRAWAPARGRPSSSLEQPRVAERAAREHHRRAPVCSKASRTLRGVVEPAGEDHRRRQRARPAAPRARSRARPCAGPRPSAGESAIAATPASATSRWARSKPLVSPARRPERSLTVTGSGLARRARPRRPRARARRRGRGRRAAPRRRRSCRPSAPGSPC